MKINKFNIDGLIEFRPTIIYDERGQFVETYKESLFKQHGLSEKFVQDNQSISKKGTFRGIHLQTGKSAQGKLVRVTKGSAIDFAVDLRPGSKTYGKFVNILLTSNSGNQFWIPAGFGHAFLALEDDTIFSYKCTKEYDKSSEECILWSDKDLDLTIDPGLLIQHEVGHILVSSKDQDGISLKEYTEKYAQTV
jgi:dTDP-4-dehydrorhamnose 3,5-epimerase